MKAVYLPGFKVKLRGLPQVVQRKFSKQVNFLLEDLRHPSLRAKKYDEGEDTWQARVDDDFRFYFLIERDTYVLLDIRKHPK